MELVTRHIPKEIKIARRFVKLHNIQIPFNLQDLVEQYATLHYKDIPIDGVDGVTLNLKVPGKRPVIVVNNNQPITRQRFTLAHELGHVIIPWHTGTIVDDIYTPHALDMQYAWTEQEANTFAAELLMPENWVRELYDDNSDDLPRLHMEIARKALVSDIAAAIRITQVLPPEIVFLTVNNGQITHTGRTEFSTAQVPKHGDYFDEGFYTLVKSHSMRQLDSVEYHWYNLNASYQVKTNDKRSWREVLAKMIADLRLPHEREAIRKSINGIVSNAHSTIKGRNSNYSPESIAVGIINKMKRNELEDFINHKDFEVFVQKRAYDFYHGIKK